jgi:hypothetical protein
LVRRTAIRIDPIRHAVDFGDPHHKHFKNEIARIHVDAYLAWAQQFRDGLTLEQFEFGLPHVAREALVGTQGSLTPKSLFKLYKRFAGEVLDTFPVP